MSVERDALAELAELAEAVASRRDVDWEAERDRADDPQEVENLRALGALMDAFARGPGGERSEAESGGEETVRFDWGHLRVDGRLGEGAFGEVYRAYDPILQRHVALKLRSSEEVEARSYIAEARRLARVRHPNVLAVHGADIHDGRVGLWADLIEGATLKEVIASRAPLPTAEVLDLAETLAEALAAVHGLGLVHGDVKGSNVMLEKGGRLVLMDFGAGVDLLAPALTGSPAGTPLSMAPELFDGAAPSAASDVYSFGVLTHRLLTGCYPVEAATFDDLRSRHLEGGPRRLRFAGRPRALTRLVEAVLSSAPDSRPSAAEAASRLTAIRSAPARRRRRLAVAAVIVALALGAVAATVGLIEARRSERRAETVNEFLREVLIAPRPVVSGPQVLVAEVLDQARGRLERDANTAPELRVEILTLLGRSYDSLDRSDDAVELLSEAARLARRIQDADDPERLGVELSLAEALIEHTGDDEATALLSAVEPAVDRLPRGHEHQLYWHRIQQRLARRRGEPRAALEHAEAAVALRQDPRTHDDWAFRLAQSNFAQALIDVGEFDRAEAELRDYLAWYEPRYGERNPNVHNARVRLAEILDRLGRASEAVPILQESAEVTAEWLGADHRRHLQVVATLSSMLASTGRLEEALELNGEVAEVLRDQTPRDDDWLHVLAGNRGLVLTEMGRYDEAEVAYREALAGIVGLPHRTPVELITRFNLAEVLLLAERPSEALTVAREARPIMVERVGEDHLFLLVTDGVIGAAETELGRLAIGRETLESALVRSREQLGSGSPHTLDLERYLAQNEWARDEREPALERLERVVAGRRSLLGAEHTKTQSAQAELELWRQGG